MRMSLAILAALAWAGPAGARVVTTTLEYRQGDAVLEGYLAYDDALQGKRPGVLVVHEWYGLNDYARRRAEQVARLGYVALAADIYGKGVRPSTPAEAAEVAGRFKADRALLRARVLAGLAALEARPDVDPARVAAIGYCFGGTGVLELARSGAALAGVVSFHGNLDTPNPGDARNIKARVLALSGADDPFVDAGQVAAFEAEMRAARVDWQLVRYGGAVHSFTNPAAGNDPSKGAAYDERADRRSWEAMRQFLKELFL
jgi:dienelactone hydrolase